MSVTLLIIENNLERFQVVEDLVFTIGRSTKNQVVLRELVSSRHHCEIRKLSEGEGYVLRDLGSRNGTQVNGQFERMSFLRKGDKITIGSTHVYFNVNSRDEIVDSLPQNPEEKPVPMPEALQEDPPYEEILLLADLLKLVKNLFESKNLKMCFKAIFDTLRNKTAADGALARLVPTPTEQMEFEEKVVNDPEIQNAMDLLFQELLSEGKPTCLIKSLKDKEAFRDQNLGPVRSLLGATIYFNEEEPVGFIGLYRDEKHPAFKEDDEHLVKQILAFGNKAIEKFRNFELAGRDKPILQLWKKLTPALARISSKEELKKKFLHHLIQESSAELGALVEISDPSDPNSAFFHGQNRKGEPLERAKFIFFERALNFFQEKSKPAPILISTDKVLGLPKEHSLISDLNLLSIIIIPLVFSDKFAGAIYLEKTLATNAFSEAQFHLALESREILISHLERFHS
ncbi:MAG: FHA domain-containing protein [Planctomycetota bacterium]